MANSFSNQDIQHFYDVAKEKDFARANLFRVISIETGTGSSIQFDYKDLVYVSSAAVPRKEIINIPVPFMGVNFNVPGTVRYTGSDAWTVKFRMPQDLTIRQKLEDWTTKTFDINTSSGNYALNDLGTVMLALMDKRGNPIRTYKLLGAYCKTIGDYTLDIADGNKVVEQEATLAYQYWEIV